VIHLVLGGARSGKSRYGEALVRQYTALGFDACYVATAQALDDEMATRIAKHQAERTMVSNGNCLKSRSPLRHC